MKKLLLVLSVAITGTCTVLAQQITTGDGAQLRLNRTENVLPIQDQSKNLSRRTAGNGWYVAANEARAAGETYLYFGDFRIWPDSLPILRYATSNDHAYILGVVSTLDSKADYLTTRLSQIQNYTVDTFFFLYKYYNPVPSHTDSLIIQIYNDSELS